MNVLRCSNGHFFDADKFDCCPHCGAAVGGPSETTADNGTGKKRGLFSHKSKGSFANSQPSPGHGVSGPKENKQFSKSDIGGSAKGASFGYGKSETRGMRASESSSKAEAFKKGNTLDFGATLDFWNNNQTDGEEPVSDHEEKKLDEEKGNIYSPRNEPITGEEEAKHSEPSGESLRDKVRNASASSDGKTTSYFSAITNKANAQEEKKKPKEIDPVVGWLVCVSGVRFGESFNIGVGTNSIGRLPSNRIALENEETVSREKHAFITYEPKHRQFYIKPGEGQSLTYVNDEYLTETKQIAGNSILEFGSSKYIFIPLCGPDFAWEDYLNC